MEKTVEFHGQRIWTESLGSPANPAVLLISGAGAHAHFWTDTFCHPFLQGDFYLIRYDHRDVGLSHPSEEEYTLEQLAEDAVEILNAYNIRAAHIVGHSMGGYIAQLLAAKFAERVLSITLVAAGPIGETPGLLSAQSGEEREILHATWRAMLQNRPTDDFEESLPGYMRVWNRLNGFYPVEEALARSYTQELYTRSRYPVGVHAKHIKVMQNMAGKIKERQEIFHDIHCPTLILHGEEDYLMLPERGGIALSKALPRATFDLVPEMGHMLFNYDLERLIAEKIVIFIQKV